MSEPDAAKQPETANTPDKAEKPSEQPKPADPTKSKPIVPGSVEADSDWDKSEELAKPNPTPGQLAWNENLAQHVEKFSYLDANGKPVEAPVGFILQTVAQWYVRKDGKYYDVEEPGPVFSRDDIERIIIQRLKEEFPGNDLSDDLVRQILQVLIKDIFVDPRTSIPIWSGLRQSLPGNANRLVFERMAATINTWREPEYRSLGGVTEADWGPVKDYLDWTFPREAERDMLVNWLAWCLQNESDKPGWAPFLYSSTKGSGKSTFAHVAKLLFGERNTGTENNVNKLVSRFNAPVLEKKLVICEELHIPPGSEKANAIKTFITEKNALTENKFQSVHEVEQVCAFIFITNHKPIWLEADDRRFYVIEVDHDGHRWGPRGTAYAALVTKMLDYLKAPENVAKLYNALMQRELPDTFSAKTLNVREQATEVMQSIRNASSDLNEATVAEWLNREKIVAVGLSVLKEEARDLGNIKLNSLKYILASLGWEARDAKWGGKDYQRKIWTRKGYYLEGGKLKGPGGWQQDTENEGFPKLENTQSLGKDCFTREDLFLAGAGDETVKDDAALDS